MGFTSFLGIGILIAALVLIKKNSLLKWVGNHHWIVRQLSSRHWFKNKWKSGFFLFFLNAVLFFAAAACILLSSVLMIPYLHLLIMVAAVFISIYLWIAFRRSDEKNRRDQFMAGLVGSSFYLVLFFIFLFMFLAMEPATPEHDTFMAAIGLMFGMIVALVAWITCLLITGTAKKEA
jgi:MFS family permease